MTKHVLSRKGNVGGDGSEETGGPEHGPRRAAERNGLLVKVDEHGELLQALAVSEVNGPNAVLEQRSSPLRHATTRVIEAPNGVAHALLVQESLTELRECARTPEHVATCSLVLPVNLLEGEGEGQGSG